MGGIVRDDYPARVTIDDRTWRKARMIVDDESRAVVVIHAESGALEIVARGTGAEITRDRSTPGVVTVTTAQGETWSVERGGGCGCGSPLKRLDRDKALAGTL